MEIIIISMRALPRRVLGGVAVDRFCKSSISCLVFGYATGFPVIPPFTRINRIPVAWLHIAYCSVDSMNLLSFPSRAFSFMVKGNIRRGNDCRRL